MMKRTLAAVGGSYRGLGTHLWAVDVAQRQLASVSVVPLLDVDSWMRLMPAVMTSGHAAQLLESQPWDVVSERLHRIQQQCKSVFETSGVPWEFVDIGSTPWECLVSETRFHDLLVFGLNGTYDPLIVPNFLETIGELLGKGACPVLAVPSAVREVKSILVAYSGTVASARALKRFVHLQLWREVPLEVVCQSDDPTEAETHLQQAQRYLLAHGRQVKVTALEGRVAELCRYALDGSADLIVAGSSQRNRLGIETTSEVLRGFLAQAKLPVFIAN